MVQKDDGWDVAIIGGGPAGSTVASLLLKYDPNLRVLILEKEKFPREHIGESQLPGISAILDEMGVWDKVEAANFPIKLGASFTWGRLGDEWDFDFYPAEEFVDEPRPAKYEGQRRFTAFQVERAVYDEILLNHAAELGAEVRQQTLVRQIHHNGDRITGLELASGEMITARHYIDCSGHAGILRRALGLQSEVPESLRNIAMWDYYDNAKWKIQIGIGGTRIQVRSLPYGWMWFIPLGPTKASVGLVCPASYYKKRGLSPKELYHEALEQQPEICELLRDATSITGDETLTTKNWSHLSERLVGENWWLAGESGGFADPVLSAGMTLAHSSARDVAYSILELDRGELDPAWIRARYDERNRRNIHQHIRFAEYWYAANSCFTDLQEHCSEIAKESGLRLSPKQAWRWLARGGFATEDPGRAGAGSFDIGSSKNIIERFSGRAATFEFIKCNEFTLNLRGAEKSHFGLLRDGRIEKLECYRRGDTMLPVTGYYQTLMRVIELEKDIKTIYQRLVEICSKSSPEGAVNAMVSQHLGVLEAMYIENWVIGKLNKRRPVMRIESGGGRLIRSREEAEAALRTSAKGTIRFASDFSSTEA